MAVNGASSSSSRYHAKLVSLDPSLDNISLTKASYLIGNHNSNDIVIKDLKFYDFECKISRGLDNTFSIQNTISHTLLVNNQYIKFGKKELEAGDRITFLQVKAGKRKEFPGFIFCAAQPVAVNSKSKRGQCHEYMESETVATDRLRDTLNIELKCCICLDYVYACVVALPCLHRFCAACISDRLYDLDVCPHCHTKFTELKKSACLNNIVETYLEQNPLLKRTAEEYNNMKIRDLVRNSYQIVDQKGFGQYRGNIENREANGSGVMLYQNGDYYEGQFVDGRRHGFGIYTFKDGRVYEGYYNRGLREGTGVLLNSDGSYYDGQWKNDHRHGTGVFVYQNGDIYEGLWKWDKRHGKGVLRMISSDAEFLGEWYEDSKWRGEEKYLDGSRFIGEWQDNLEEGSEESKDADGVVHRGTRVNDGLYDSGL